MDLVSGTTIEIFLPEDDPRGIRVAEITTGVVAAVQVPRSHVKKVAKLCSDLGMPEAAMYLLLESDEESAKPRIYIGQSDCVSRRLREHDGRKDFWETAIFFVSGKSSFTPSHIEYLEWHASEVARKIGRYNVLHNNCAQPSVRLPLKQEILKYFESIRLLSATLGTPAFDPIIAPGLVSTEKKTLFCKGDGAAARALMMGSEFVVLAGSTARTRIARSAIQKIEPLRDRLFQAGVLVQKGALLSFTQDFPFNSPSAAANVVLGRNVNGWDFWKDQSGRTIDEIYRSNN